MSKDVKFGVDTSEENIENVQEINSNNKETEKFGVNHTVEKNKIFDYLNKIFRVFKLQSSGFWIKKYIYSLIAFYLFYSLFIDVPVVFMVLAVMNLILYPLFAAVLEDMQSGRFTGIKEISTLGITRLLNLFTRFGVTGEASMNYVVYQIITFITFVIKWSFSFILGIFAFFYMTILAGKMGY